jgi:predicted SprT family Zn-dependent metalloprotease
MQSFKTLRDVERYANELLAKTFTINVMGYIETKVSAKDLGYRFQFDSAKRRFGVCRYTRRIIGLSKPLVEMNLDNFKEINDTILHEIAHAIAYYIDRYEGKGHGWLWREVAMSIGCNGERCYKGSDINEPTSKYSLECPSCDRKRPMHRKPKKTYACGKCCTNGYDEKYKMIVKQNY